MRWLKALLGIDNDHIKRSSSPSPEQIAQLTEDYLAVLKDEGATCNPSDYANTLNSIPKTLDIPGKWPGMPLCGCCSVPFAVDPRKSGLWVATGSNGRQAGTIVPICAVCILWLNKHYGQDRFKLETTYDSVGQQISSKFPLDDLKKLAVVRIALLRSRVSTFG